MVVINQVRMVFDSDLDRNTWQGVDSNIKRFPMRCSVFAGQKAVSVPETLVKAFRLEVFDEIEGWKTVYREENNYQRLVKVNLDVSRFRIRLVPESTWGCETVNLFAFDAR